MKRAIMTALLVVSGVALCHAQTDSMPIHKKIIYNYFDGWVKKDWSIVASQLSNDFTFTSPAPDDHISLAQFKEKCWPQAQHIKSFEFIKILGNEDNAFALMHVITTEGKVIRNIDILPLRVGK